MPCSGNLDFEIPVFSEIVACAWAEIVSFCILIICCIGISYEAPGSRPGHRELAPRA